MGGANIVMAWNTAQMQRVLDDARKYILPLPYVIAPKIRGPQDSRSQGMTPECFNLFGA
jgi:hypothetical protein